MDANGIDTFVRRTRLWIGTLIMLLMATAAAGGWVVKKATDQNQQLAAEVRKSVADTHDDLVALASLTAERAETDSLRFERAMTVLELAVGAIVEPDGSPEQRSAIAELRRRRHVTP